LFTSDYILVECWFLIQSRLGRKAALKFWDGLRTGIVKIVKVEPQDLERAREIVARNVRSSTRGIRPRRYEINIRMFIYYE